jgi:DNA-binding transcriptional MerR regulator
MRTFRIKELADSLKVSRRTIHYYLARGLLPPSEGAGLGTTYSDEHYYRILLIKKWQKAFLPLEEIRQRLQKLNLEEVKICLEEEEPFLMKKTILEKPPQGICWQRIPLAKGLELHYKSEDTQAAKQADEIVSWFFHRKKEG